MFDWLRKRFARAEPPGITPRLIGYWKASLTDSYALPRHFEAALEPAVRAAVVAYLDGGRLVNQFRGLSECRSGCGANGSAERTDGDWVWPTGFAHYVEAHDVAPPREIIEHVMRRGKPPARIDAAGVRVHADERDWLRWSDERMPAAFKAAVRDAIAAAEQCAAARLDAAVHEKEALLGVSDAQCMQTGCERDACRDRALCARCLNAGDGTEELIRGQCQWEQLAALLESTA